MSTRTRGTREGAFQRRLLAVLLNDLMHSRCVGLDRTATDSSYRLQTGLGEGTRHRLYYPVVIRVLLILVLLASPWPGVSLLCAMGGDEDGASTEATVSPAANVCCGVPVDVPPTPTTPAQGDDEGACDILKCCVPGAYVTSTPDSIRTNNASSAPRAIDAPRPPSERSQPDLPPPR